jgi:hypothetical protein
VPAPRRHGQLQRACEASARQPAGALLLRQSQHSSGMAGQEETPRPALRPGRGHVCVI